MSEYYGVDVSDNNGYLNWENAKGIYFAILRITELHGVDSTFVHNYEGCKAAGIKVGGYKYSYATHAVESKKEAEDVVAALAGRGLDFPVFLDLEWFKQETFSKSLINDIIESFAEVIKMAGYKFAIYCNDYWYKDIIPDEAKKKYEFWIAKVPYEANDDGTIHQSIDPGYGIGWQYSWNGRVEGLPGAFDMDVFYKDYSTDSENSPGVKNDETIGVTADDVLNLARSWLGRNEYDGTHRMIIDTYNSYIPRARGYKVQYDDQWCDTFVSALYIKLNAVYLIGGPECGVEEHIKIFKANGIWIEDGNIIPNPGYLICYNWGDTTQPNDGYADHIGIVETCNGTTITVIEGNYKDSVARRTIPVGWGYIRGFASPKYAEVSSAKKPETNTTPGKLSKDPKWVGQVTADVLNVRTWAGTEYPNIKSWPVLKRGNLIDVCDTVKDKNGNDWYYVRIAGKYYGFCSAKYISRQ